MKIAIFDKIILINYALKNILNKNFNPDFIDFFTNFDNLKNFLTKNQIDFLFLDINYDKRDGLDIVRYLHNEYPKMKIIVLTEIIRPETIFAAVKNGANAYLFKQETDENEIINALEKVMKNDEYFSDTVSNIILKNFVSNIKKGEEISEKKPRNLTRREIQILKLVCEGLTNKQIAEGLFISVRTVDAHKNHIMQKLGLKTTAGLVKYAIKNGYVSLD